MLRYLIAPLAALAALGLVTAAGASDAPKVVVSIKPLHSLVAGVMDGLGEPVLLVQGAGSPHSYSLRPSEARALEQADLVVWVGPGLESFLQKPLGALAGKARILELGAAGDIALLDTRAGGAWEADEHQREEHEQGAHDLHIWLDPDNVGAIVRSVQAALSAIDPPNAARYAKNADGLQARIASLDGELAESLAAVKDRPFVVFHDAYQYFERHYGLNGVGAITLEPERAPGARRLSELRARIGGLGAACVFSEPQFEPALVETLTEGLAVKTAVLDPLGAELAAGQAAYFTLMRALAEGLVACLETGG